MNGVGYTITALIVLACTGYLLLAPVWGRRKPPSPKWGRQHKVGEYTADYSKVTAKQLAEIPSEHDALLARSRVVSRRTDVRSMSAERMRSVRHETRKPRSPVRAVRTDPVPVETPSDISTLLTIGLLNATSSPDCAPSDSSSSSHDSGGSCDSGGGGGGGD